MAKTQRLFQSILLIILLLGTGSLALGDTDGQDGRMAVIRKSSPSVVPFTPPAQGIPDSSTLVAENENFQLYLNESTLAFKVVDKRSGYVWHSNLDEVGADDRLNRTWTAFAQSGISIDYLDQKATRIRASITNTNQSIVVNPIEQGFAATVQFLDPSITLTVLVQLEPEGVNVQVPFDSIKEEDPAFKLGLLHVYPFLGATRDDQTPGYMFIPDGVGTLIRFAAQTKAKNMFYGRYYGADLGMITAVPYDPTINRPFKISIPVIGMVHGEKENAFIAIVENGAPYGEIQAHPAGIITNFNFLYNVFIYNESYFQATNRAGAGVTTLQPSTNRFDVSIHYRFLTGEAGDYVGMANSYQVYLVDKGMLHQTAVPGDNIGIRLEFLGAEKEKILFWHRAIPMTTIAQMDDILADLEVENPEVVYYGWQPLGASTMPPHSLRLERRLGNKQKLEALVGEVTAVGGNFYLYLDPQAALRDEGGYSTRRDLAMSITNFNLIGHNRNKVNYYLNYEALHGRYAALSADVSTDLQAGLALDGIGSMLYSDFKRNNFLNRADTIAQYQALLAERNIPLAFYMPNDYLFGFMQAYFDMPLTNSGYLYAPEAVPFLPIILAGYVPFYGPALNFSSNTRQDLLRHIDFGVYPSYFLTQEITANILNTSSNWIYSSSYGQWGPEIEANYQWLNGLLGPVAGQRITARQTLAPGVFATTYGNNKQIIVNYNNTPYVGDGVAVGSQDAVVREVTP